VWLADIAREKLQQLIARFGHDLCNDARRCEALLRDVCADRKREIFVLVNAARERVGHDLLELSSGVPVDILLARLTKRLEENLGLPEPLARWGVESWAIALGVAVQILDVPFKCPACGAKGKMAARLAGQTVKCPRCKRSLRISEDASISVSAEVESLTEPAMASYTNETLSSHGSTVSASVPRSSDDALRPQHLGDFVGQMSVVTRLKISVDVARKRNEPLGHLLLAGPPGIGKTTLVNAIHHELGTELQVVSGASLSTFKELLPFLTNASYGSVLFIDEVHRISSALEEVVCRAMEDFRVEIKLGDGSEARTVDIKLNVFTLIGTTTHSELLAAPILERFLNREHLGFYDVDEIAEIVRRNARELQTQISDAAVNEIACRSRGTPRKANSLLRWARDYAVSKSDGRITAVVAKDAFLLQEIDEIGLEVQDRRYLTALINAFSGGPVGLQAVAQQVNISPAVLEDEVEPFLLRIGFLSRTPRGRMITPAALAHMNRSRACGVGDEQERRS
jgi:Holliday junction DNA helicase RuvB